MTWKARIGADPWRACIAEECRLVPPGSENAWHFGPKLADSFGVDGQRKFDESFWVQCSKRSEKGFSDSYHVFQAGRHFLVNPFPALIEEFNNAYPTDHCHVVILRWDFGATLKDLNPLINGNRNVTIWTSDWIWQELLYSANDDAVLKFPRLSFHDAEAELARRRPDLAGKVILFDQYLRLDLTCGVTIYLDYVPSDHPSLRVALRCNHLYMTIDPHQKRFDGLCDQSLQNFFGPSEAIAEFVRRHALHAQSETLGAECSLPWLLDYPLPWKYGQIEWRGDGQKRRWTPKPALLWNFDCAVDCPGTCQPDQHYTKYDYPDPKPDCTPNHVGDPTVSQECPPGNVIVIPCGIVKQTEGTLLDPGRILTFNVYGANQPNPEASSVEISLSILQWRLHKILAWASVYKSSNVPIPVILIVSPETDRIVAEEVSRFNATIRELKVETKLELIIAPQLLVPALTKPKDNQQSTYTLKDGGWLLQARGQMDFLRILQRWYLRSGDLAAECSCAIVFSYNNLGTLFDAATNARLIDCASSKHLAAVELYKLEQGQNDKDERWEVMSRAASFEDDETKSNTLVTLTKPGSPQTGSSWFSTNTWYFNLSNLGKIDLDTYSRYLHAEKDDLVWPRQDIELITLLSNSKDLRVKAHCLNEND